MILRQKPCRRWDQCFGLGWYQSGLLQLESIFRSNWDLFTCKKNICTKWQKLIYFWRVFVEIDEEIDGFFRLFGTKNYGKKTKKWHLTRIWSFARKSIGKKTNILIYLLPPIWKRVARSEANRWDRKFYFYWNIYDFSYIYEKLPLTL